MNLSPNHYILTLNSIISGIKESFEPAKYHDEYRQRLWEIIQAKANNQEITATPEESQGSVINMYRTKNGGYRQPVFKGLREDKAPEECVV